MTDTGGSADDGKWVENCIIQDLTLEWDFNAQGVSRLMQMSGTWIGTEINLEQTMSGTTVDTTLAPYNDTESYSFTAFTVGGVDWTGLAFRRFSFAVNNNVTKDDATTAGKANQFNVKPEYTSQIVLNYDETSEKVMMDYQQGSGVTMTFVSSTDPGSDGGLSIVGVKGELMSPPEIYEGEYKGVNIDVKWYANAAATPLTIVMSDTQDWTYGADA
jgi:hypothetical protein